MFDRFSKEVQDLAAKADSMSLEQALDAWAQRCYEVAMQPLRDYCDREPEGKA